METWEAMALGLLLGLAWGGGYIHGWRACERHVRRILEED